MEFIDPFNSWSLVHFTGSLLFTVALGSLIQQFPPVTAGGLVFGMGITWETLADQNFREDPRGGDYFDLMWDLGGSMAGILFLRETNHYQRTHQIELSSFEPQPRLMSLQPTPAWDKWYKPRPKSKALEYLPIFMDSSKTPPNLYLK